jgi:hypothetical protein
MTLDGLETAVYASVGPTALARSNNQLNVIRYADDFIVTGISKEVLETKVLPAVRNFMAARGLELSEEKTRITHIAEGFDFLGQNVRKYKGETSDQTQQGKCQVAAGQGQGDHQKQCQRPTGGGYPQAQSCCVTSNVASFRCGLNVRATNS